MTDIFKKISDKACLALSLCLLFAADMAVSTDTFLFWGEAKCPKELLG